MSLRSRTFGQPVTLYEVRENHGDLPGLPELFVFAVEARETESYVWIDGHRFERRQLEHFGYCATPERAVALRVAKLKAKWERLEREVESARDRYQESLAWSQDELAARVYHPKHRRTADAA